MGRIGDQASGARRAKKLSWKGALCAPCQNLAISVCVVQLWMYNTCVGCREVERVQARVDSIYIIDAVLGVQAWPRVHGRRPVLRPVLAPCDIMT